jgi:hypothetical protein
MAYKAVIHHDVTHYAIQPQRCCAVTHIARNWVKEVDIGGYIPYKCLPGTEHSLRFAKV